MIKKVIYIVLFLLSPNVFAAYTLKDKDVEIESGYIVKCNYNFSQKNIVIPKKLCGQIIVGIKGYAGFYNKGILSVRFPKTLKEIGYGAFKNNELTEVIFPSSVIVIGIKAFENNRITNLKLPNSLLQLKNKAFCNNYIKQVQLPASLIEININAFAQNPVSRIILPFNADRVGYHWVDSNDEVVTNSVIELKENLEYPFYKAVFKYALTPKDVEIENGVLKKVYAQEGIYSYFVPAVIGRQKVVSIGRNAFDNVPIKDVALQDGVQCIEDYAFDNHKELDKVIFPSSLSYKGEEVFYGSMEFFELPQMKAPFILGWYKMKTDYSNDGRFYYTYVPDTVIKSFKQERLAFVKKEFPETDSLIIKNGVITKYLGHKLFIHIPDNVDCERITGIGDKAFADKDIMALYISKGIEKIGVEAFSNCRIIKVIIEDRSQLKEIGIRAFQGNIGLKEIVLPVSYSKKIQNWNCVQNRAMNYLTKIRNFYLSYQLEYE